MRDVHFPFLLDSNSIDRDKDFNVHVSVRFMIFIYLRPSHVTCNAIL